MSQLQERYRHECLAVLGQADRLADDAGVVELFETIAAVAAVLDAPYWFFSVFEPMEGQEGYHFFSGAPPTWPQEYLQHRWYAIDHSLLYARQSAMPTQLSLLPMTSDGQRNMVREARQHDIVDGFVVPAHSAVRRKGALQFFYPSRTQMPLARFQALRVALRSFASVALDTVVSSVRQEFLEASGINARDRALLQYAASGYNSRQIAEQMALSSKAVDQQFARLMGRLQVHRRADAVTLAQRHEVL